MTPIRAASILIAVLVLAAQPGPSLAAQSAQSDGERITSFESVIEIAPSGVLDVTERITAVAKGQTINHGIYRDLILPERNFADSMAGPPFRVREVLRDGHSESWHTGDHSGMMRIYLGSKDTTLRPGVYTYTLSYDAISQVRFFKDFDEIYYNITGNGWAFPIDHVRAEIILPPGATVKQYAAYTGPTGFKGRDFTARMDGPGRMVFETTAPLQPGEGLTVAVGWPKGIVQQPTLTQSLLGMVLGSPFMMAALAGFLAMLAYFTVAWFKVGRDPAPGTIIPLYAPPQDISPAAARYVSRMSHDSKDLACAVVSLAVNGALTIEEKSTGKFVLHRPDGARAPKLLDEELTATAFFKNGTTLPVDQPHRQRLISARDALRKALHDAYTGFLFNLNLNWFYPGVILAALTVAAIALAGEQWQVSAFMIVWLSFWTIAVIFLLSRVAESWRNAAHGRGRILKVAGALFTTAFALPFFLGEVVGLTFLGLNASPLAVAILMATIAACASFYHLLKAPTQEGRKVMDHLEGFKLYLSVAEQERLNMLNPPEETPELFEKYLPYAMALDVEQLWGERFAGVLAQAAQTPDGYTPVWYSGSSWNPSSPGDFTDSLSSGFSSAVSSSTSSSSGSGGGGSSGGGGGGGGGGGW